MGTDRDWEIWGRQNPYYGVVSHKEFKAENIEQNRALFFAGGRQKIESFLRHYEATFGQIPHGSALDFGCGVGRLTIPLASAFDKVWGLDVSPSMLAEAARNATLENALNTTFALADSNLSNAPTQLDFVISYIVLQHIPPKRGLVLIEKLLAKVKPGGGCLIHVSLKRRNGVLAKIAYWIRFNIPGLGAIFNLLRGRRWNTPGMQMNEYPLLKLLELFETNGMRDLRAFTEDHGGILTIALMGHRMA